jgi:hypothetical protein
LCCCREQDSKLLKSSTASCSNVVAEHGGREDRLAGREHDSTLLPIGRCGHGNDSVLLLFFVHVPPGANPASVKSKKKAVTLCRRSQIGNHRCSLSLWFRSRLNEGFAPGFLQLYSLLPPSFFLSLSLSLLCLLFLFLRQSLSVSLVLALSLREAASLCLSCACSFCSCVGFFS